MKTAWRVVKEKHARTAFDGEGARRAGGRFNSPGTAVVYTSDSLALALLEVAVHVPSYVQLYGRVYVPVRFDDDLIEILRMEDLPPDWRTAPPSRSTQGIGDDWVRKQRTAVLRVPSVIVPSAYNYILNPAHPDFTRIDVGAPETLPVDPRLVK